jgi:hypothetical protein
MFRRHLRSLITAVAVLALSAGLVAGREMPEAAADGLATAAEAAGKIVPVGPPAPTEAAPTLDETAPEEDAPELDEEAPAPEDGDATENHGSFVSEAAKGDTPDGFKNHGAYVSSVAKSDAGKPAKDEPEAASEKTKGRSAEAKGKSKSGDRGGN